MRNGKKKFLCWRTCVIYCMWSLSFCVFVWLNTLKICLTKVFCNFSCFFFWSSSWPLIFGLPRLHGLSALCRLHSSCLADTYLLLCMFSVDIDITLVLLPYQIVNIIRKRQIDMLKYQSLFILMLTYRVWLTFRLIGSFSCIGWLTVLRICYRSCKYGTCVSNVTLY